MKKLFLAAAIIGMTGFAFGQQQQTASTTSKDAKCSKTCTKSCGKSCKKGSCCTNAGKASTAPTSSTSTSTTATKSATTK